VNVAALSSGPPPAELAKPVQTADLTKSVQTELRRVGCLSGDANGEWNAASQRSMALFNRNAKTKFDAKVASVDALDAIKLKPARVCPLICQHGFEADGDHLQQNRLRGGSFLNDNNECEKRREKTPTARRDSDGRPDRSERLARPERLDLPVRPRPAPRSACPDPRHRARSFATRAVAGRLGTAVASTIRVAHLAVAAEAMRKSATEGGGSNIQICP